MFIKILSRDLTEDKKKWILSFLKFKISNFHPPDYRIPCPPLIRSVEPFFEARFLKSSGIRSPPTLSQDVYLNVIQCSLKFTLLDLRLSQSSLKFFKEISLPFDQASAIRNHKIRTNSSHKLVLILISETPMSTVHFIRVILA